MGEIKWIRITANIFEDEKMRLIDAMPERDTVHYVWIRLLVQAGKNNCNGFIFLSEKISYTEEMLSTLFSRPLASIRLALKILKDFEMIQIDDNNFIKIVNWEKHQNIEGMERVREQTKRRVNNHRAKKKELEAAPNNEEDISKDNETETTKNKEDESDTTKARSKEDEDNTVKVKSDEGFDFENSSSKHEDITKGNSASIASNSCDITDDKCNVTVTQQNKREKENKNKIKNSLLEREYESDISSNSKGIELLKYYEKMTGYPNVISLGAVNLAIETHGEEHVKMAINKAIELNKLDVNYINGILKNWRREGYPKEKEEERKNVNTGYGKNQGTNKSEFAGFKPKEPRKLTEHERRKVEKELI